MRAAAEAIAHVQVRREADVAEYGRLLAAFASDYGFQPALYAEMALHARAIAMDRWEAIPCPKARRGVSLQIGRSIGYPRVERIGQQAISQI